MQTLGDHQEADEGRRAGAYANTMLLAWRRSPDGSRQCYRKQRHNDKTLA